MSFCKAVSKRVNQILKNKNMTYYQLAVMSGLPQGSVDSIKYATTSNITLKKIAKICLGLNMTLTEFFDDPVFDLNNFDI